MLPQRLVVTQRSTVATRPRRRRSAASILEADSFEWHGDRRALRRDARRYNLLVVDGWIVLRFAWEDVMFDPDYVRDVLVAVVELRTPTEETRRMHLRRRVTSGLADDLPPSVYG